MAKSQIKIFQNITLEKLMIAPLPMSLIIPITYGFITKIR